MAQVLAPEVELVLVVAPSGDQAGGPRLGGGTRAPVPAGGDGSLPGSGGGAQVAVDRWLGELHN